MKDHTDSCRYKQRGAVGVWLASVRASPAPSHRQPPGGLRPLRADARNRPPMLVISSPVLL
ncbi:MAG: hypothetical protein VB026_04850 [Anaerolineaceae bacterium]|nr:hypothetical protein [Anaerolineaceae bacterium]